MKSEQTYLKCCASGQRRKRQCGISFYPLKVGDLALIDTNGGGCVGHVGAVTHVSRLHIHSGNSWTKYNATYHRGLCNGGCGEFVLAQHYARTPGSNATCLGCGYVGNISIGLMSMGDKLS